MLILRIIAKIAPSKAGLLTKSVNTDSKVLSLYKLKDYAELTKYRLTSFVVISAVLGYVLAMQEFNWVKLIALSIGGFLVTGASNGINQIIERNLDAVMTRTASRPLPAGRLSVWEATVFSVLIGVAGVFMLFYFLNPLSGWLGLWALVLYTAVYTPLKRVGPIAVFVGAIPGAIPPMLGWVAETGQFGLVPGLLFAVQFIWQFPHFWAIAWKLDDDYKKAGFKLLPSKEGKSKFTAFQTVIYTISLIGISVLPTLFGITGIVSLIAGLILGGWFLSKAYKLYQTCSDEAASKLMFASFIYLPVMLIVYVIDKV